MRHLLLQQLLQTCWQELYTKEAFKRYAWEEAEHAAKFAELLGDCVWDTKTNLQKRKDAEQNLSTFAHEVIVQVLNHFFVATFCNTDNVLISKSQCAKKMKKFRCTVCGYVYEGDAAPEKCPLCKAPASKFVEVVHSNLSTFAHEVIVQVLNHFFVATFCNTDNVLISKLLDKR